MPGKTGSMTSRERVHAAAKGLPVDRVPVFHWINGHAAVKLMSEYQPSIHEDWNLLAKRFWDGFKNGGFLDAPRSQRLLPLVFDLYSSNYGNRYGLELGSDILLASFATPGHFSRSVKQNGTELIVDIYGVGRDLGNSIYANLVNPPIKTVEDLVNYRFPDITHEHYYDVFREMRLQHPDASIGTFIWGVQDFCHTCMMGTERFMTFIVDYPEEISHFMGRVIDHSNDIVRRSLAAGADLVFTGDDFGYNNRPLISMNMWREFTFPQLKRQVDLSHELGAPVMLHSCGYQMCFLEDYIKLGIDLLQSFQPMAGNNFQEAYPKYGDKFGFVTGVDTQRGEMMNPEELQEEIISNYRLGKTRPRFILGMTHEIQYTMPDDNVKVIFQTVRDIQNGHYD